MTFIAAKKGLILSPELEAQLKTASSIPPAPGAKPATRRIQFGGDAYGYAGLGGGGPGGSEEMIVATLPSKGIDVQVKMEFPREELDTVPGTEAYHRLLEEGGEQLAQRLIECVKLTVIGAANLRTASNEQPRQSSPTPAATTLAPSVPDQTPKPNASPLVSTPVPQTPAATIEHNTALWPWLVGIATLIVIVMVALKRRA